MKRFLLTSVLAVGMVLPAFGGPKQAGSGLLGLLVQSTLVKVRDKASLGDADAQFRMGLFYAHGRGVKADFAHAAMWYRRAAEQGHGEAQYRLAMLYAFGSGLPRNAVLAHMWATLAKERMKTKKAVGEFLSRLEERMTPQQSRLAEKLTRAWRTMKAQPDTASE